MYQRQNNSSLRLAPVHSAQQRNSLRSRVSSQTQLHQEHPLHSPLNPYFPRNPLDLQPHPAQMIPQKVHSPYHYIYPAQLVPLTPIDFPYTPMLPSNLLATPSPYMGHASFLALQPSLPRHSSHSGRTLPVYAGPAYASPVIGATPPFVRAHSLPVLSYVSQHLPSGSMEHLKLSRTVMLRYINPEVSITELLDEIDVGPIEYCKMFTVSSPSWLKQHDEFKACSISFVNTQISLFFILQYAKYQSNLRVLKEKLKNSVHLQISLNELHVNHLHNQDLLKVKTLKYIQDMGALRALLFRFTLEDKDSPINLENPVLGAQKTVHDRCSHFGEIEHFILIPITSDREFEVVVHYTAIDSSIKAYESLKKLANQEKNSRCESDNEGGSFHDITFARDRCDRVEIHPEPSCRRSAASLLSVLSLSLANFSGIKKRSSHSRSASAEITEDDGEDPHITLESVSSYRLNHSGTFRNAHAKGLSSVSESFEPYPQAEGIQLDGVRLNESVRLDEFPQEDDLVSVSSSNSEGLLHPMNGELCDPFTMSTTGLYLARLAASFSSLNYVPSTHLSSSLGSAAGPLPTQHAVSFGTEMNIAQNRTLFFGNLHPNTTIEEIANNVRAGGLVEWIKAYPSKRICFITFIDPAVALKFYMMHQVYHQLVIHGNEVSVRWGKTHSGPLNRDISLAVTAGASRNVYIGFKKPKDRDAGVYMPREDELRQDFAQFGDLEQVNFYQKRSCGFVNFLNIVDAITLVDGFKSGDSAKITLRIGDNGKFYAKYSRLNISFGKDRCGNPLRFSFRKLDRWPVLSAPNCEARPTANASSEQSPERPESLNQEAAMVFGISTESPALKLELATPKSPSRPGKYEKQYADKETVVLASDTIKTSCHKNEEQVLEPSTMRNSKNLSIGKDSKEPVTEEQGRHDDCSDSESNDEDIAIIIESDTKHKQKPRKTYRHEKVFHNRGGYSDDAFNFVQPIYGKHPAYDYRTMGYPAQSNIAYAPLDGRAFSVEFRPLATRASSSGSQVMADYLAKSNQDQMLFLSAYASCYVQDLDRRRQSRRSSGIDRRT